MKASAKTARRRRASYPVEHLRSVVSELETAIAEVLARPRKEAVHRLRAATRRIEAHLEVVSELGVQEPGFAAVERPARRVRKLLDRLRRAAGRVRDLDVQRRLAKECAASGTTRTLRRETKYLRGRLKVERDDRAKALVAMLEAQALKLEPRLETLLDGLEPVSNVGMTAVDLEALTRDWHHRRVDEAERETKPKRRMHGLRKAAKLARYMAENGLAQRVVKEFEALQDAGGRWHDLLTLRDAARELLGRRSGLVGVLEQQEGEARRAFEELAAG